MIGEYVGEGGAGIEFYHESALVACGDAAVAYAYTVEQNGGQILVNIQNDATPIVLDLRRDGTLAGSGSVAVNGRVLVGRNANGELAFAPRSGRCTMGILTPTQAGRR